MKRVAIAIIVLQVALLACAQAKAPARVVTLKSGRTVSIIASGPIQFGNGSMSLMVKYETQTNIDDTTALRDEANQVIAVIGEDIVRNGYKSAILSANMPSKGGFFEHSKGYNFVFELQADGTWKEQQKSGT